MAGKNLVLRKMYIEAPKYRDNIFITSSFKRNNCHVASYFYLSNTMWCLLNTERPFLL